MDAVEFQGDRRDLDRFALHVLKQSIAIEEPSPFEHRLRWDTGGCSGLGRIVDLRSGLKLSATTMRWDRPWSFQIHEPASSLKFILARGPGPRMKSSSGPSYVMGEGDFQVRCAARATSTTCTFAHGGAEFEQLALEVEPKRLRELLGASRLPSMLETLLSEPFDRELHEQPMVPKLSRLLDEILGTDGRGSSRQLFLEAKGLELLAVLIDELALASEATAPLSTRDIERLAKAQRLLMERMVAPPSLPELARAVGLNEFKLKTGFRQFFGASVFGYLRAQRMELARRLLVQRDLSITEIAARVGYDNASKFAAAFRKHFHVPPSAFR